MKKYLKAVYQSFGSPALYTDAIYRWTGAGLTYLVVLATLISLVIAGQLAFQIYRFNTTVLASIASQIPTVTIANGEASATVKQPYVIVDEDRKPLIVINTTDAEAPKDKGAVYLAKNHMLVKQQQGTYKRFELKEFGKRTYTINRDAVTSFFNQLPFMIFLFLPVIILAQWIVGVVMTILAATLSYVVTAYMPEEYNFETRMRMAAVAITPPLIVSKLVEILAGYHLGFWVILAVWILHLYVMILATRFHLKNHPIDVA